MAFTLAELHVILNNETYLADPQDTSAYLIMRAFVRLRWYELSASPRIAGN